MASRILSRGRRTGDTGTEGPRTAGSRLRAATAAAGAVPWWRWAVVVAATAALGWALEAVGVPSGVLFAGLVVGVAVALSGLAGSSQLGPRGVPRPVGVGAQGVLGVLIGALVQPSTLASLGSDWLPVVLATVATLAVSVAAGLLLGRHRDVDLLTGSFALTAGGASGLVAISRQLGADERLVAVVQYLRVLVVTGSLPLVLLLTGAGSGGTGATAPGADASLTADLLLTAVAVAVGLVLGRLARLPAPALLGPLLVATAAALLGLSGDATAPPFLVQVAYGAIGLQAGLSFTRDSVRVVRRILPAALGLIVAVIVGCAGLGALLSWVTGTSLLDGYLATTPGGLYAVLAAAVSTGSDVTFVLAVQVLRLLTMLLAAPLLTRGLHRLTLRRAARTPG